MEKTKEEQAVLDEAKVWRGCCGTRQYELASAIDALKKAEAGHDLIWALQKMRAGGKVRHGDWPRDAYLASSYDEYIEVAKAWAPGNSQFYDLTGWFLVPEKAGE